MAVYTEVSTWAALKNAIDEGGDYDEYVVVTGPITANSTTTTVASPRNPDRTITLSSKGGPHTVELTVNGSLFTINANTELILKNITLQGRTGNNAPLVRVNTNGKLVLHSGGKITGNTTTGNGGGVYVSGIFTMSGGIISGNTANGTVTDAGGGGVFIDNGGIFNMSSGSIIGNTAASNGGGVIIGVGGNFNMNGGTIGSNNEASMHGGGVVVDGIFTMRGNAIIHGNNSTLNGGGVYVNIGTFIMEGGIISGNTTVSNGGGVYISNYGTFYIVAVTIYGSVTSTPKPPSGYENTAPSSGTGPALFINTGGGSAQRGTFTGSGGSWVFKGSLSNTDTTIRMVNRELQ